MPASSRRGRLPPAASLLLVLALPTAARAQGTQTGPAPSDGYSIVPVPGDQAPSAPPATATAIPAAPAPSLPVAPTQAAPVAPAPTVPATPAPPPPVVPAAPSPPHPNGTAPTPRPPAADSAPTSTPATASPVTPVAPSAAPGAASPPLRGTAPGTISANPVTPASPSPAAPTASPPATDNGPASSPATPSPAAPPATPPRTPRSTHRASREAATSGDWRLHRDGADWRFAPARGGVWTRCEVDLVGAGIAGPILRAARAGTVTLYLSGRIVPGALPVLVARTLEGSVPDDPFPRRRFRLF